MTTRGNKEKNKTPESLYLKVSFNFPGFWTNKINDFHNLINLILISQKRTSAMFHRSGIRDRQLKNLAARCEDSSIPNKVYLFLPANPAADSTFAKPPAPPFPPSLHYGGQENHDCMRLSEQGAMKHKRKAAGNALTWIAH
jgi:hypothetical protein